MSVIDEFVKSSAKGLISNSKSLSIEFATKINRIQGYVGTSFEVAKNGETFFGIEHTEVSNIRAAIKEYVTKLQNELSDLNTKSLDLNNIKDDVITTTVTSYVKAVDDVVEAYVSALLSYSNKMYKYVYKVGDNKAISQKYYSNNKE